MNEPASPGRSSLAERLIDRSPQRVDAASEAWARRFAKHARKARRLRRVMRALPADPRCKLCHAPFRGSGGRLLRFTGMRASRKSPHLCHDCVEDGPDGGFEAEVGILFGDVRNFTGFAESRSPTETAATLQRFYDIAAKAVIRHEGIVDKLVGDEVMALFWPIVMDEDARTAMVAAAEELLDGLGYGSGDEPWLPLGIGVDFGRAYIGNVGGEGSRDFTALGDVVNTAARLQGEARAGEIVMTERVYGAVGAAYPDASPSEVSLKGKSRPTVVYRLERAAAPVSV